MRNIVLISMNAGCNMHAHQNCELLKTIKILQRLYTIRTFRTFRSFEAFDSALIYISSYFVLYIHRTIHIVTGCFDPFGIQYQMYGHLELSLKIEDNLPAMQNSKTLGSCTFVCFQNTSVI